MLSRSSLRTEDLTILSHVHGRDRRQLRGIEKRELQAALKHGRKEYANPGRDGSARFRYTYNGVVYITDSTCKHEITSWRLNETENEREEEYGMHRGDITFNPQCTSHTIFVVDCSASMRNNDVDGFLSRTEAVYETIINDFITPQLSDTNLGKAEVSLIEMRNESRLIFERQPISHQLADILKDRGTNIAKSHGHYILALDALTHLLKSDVGRAVQLLVIFLSDGAPSDHVYMTCDDHEMCTFATYYAGGKSKSNLGYCNQKCLRDVRGKVLSQCLDRIGWLGDTFGRDRVQVYTVAFGPANEEYTVLQKMAGVLPRSAFLKLGLSSLKLKTTFSSFSSTLTSLRSVTADMGKMTLRSDVQKEETSKDNYLTHEEEEDDILTDDWKVYYKGYGLLKKEKCVMLSRGGFAFEEMDFDEEVIGVAIMRNFFAEGAERLAFRCREVKEGFKLAAMIGIPLRSDLEGKACMMGVKSYHGHGYHILCKVLHSGEIVEIQTKCLRRISDTSVRVIKYHSSRSGEGLILKDRGGGWFVTLDGRVVQIPERHLFKRDELFPPVPFGLRLVAKESKYKEKVFDANFHEVMAAISKEASDLSADFNMLLRSLLGRRYSESFRISFLSSKLYTLETRPGKTKVILVEPELEGNFTKWNNNNGGVNDSYRCYGDYGADRTLNAIDEDSDEDSDDDQVDVSSQAFLNSIPQCFSHFTSLKSRRKSLVCDLQGVWNKIDGFTLTDPVIHISSGVHHKNGATDKGQRGIDAFHKSHICGSLCEMMKRVAHVTVH